MSRGGYAEKYENCCLSYMADCKVAILELSGRHYGEEKSVGVWLCTFVAAMRFHHLK